MPDDLSVAAWAPPGGPGLPRARPRPGPGGLRAARLGPALLAAGACAGLFAFYLCQSRAAPFNSDGAANVLQGQAMLHGNPLLRGWWTSDVSFYTTELPLYALVTAVAGLTPAVVHVCGALTYTLTVLLAALVARGGTPGRAGWSRAAVAAGIMLAPSILGGTEVFLANPDHAGTAVPVLLVLLLSPGGSGWLRPAAVCLLLVLAQVGDELALAAVTIPLAVVCAARLAASRLKTPSPHTAQRADARRDGALLAAAVAAAGLAWLAVRAIRALGGFDPRPIGGVALAPLRAVPGHARALGQTLALLFGANQPGVPHQPQMISAHGALVALAGLHAVGLVLAGAGLAAGIAAVARRRADRVTAVLVVSIALLLAAALFTTVLRSLSNAHEVAILLPLTAALAGRLLLPAAASLDRRAPGHPALARVGSPALAAWLALSLAGLGYAATWPADPPAQQAVASWLTAHHQRAGLAGYWQASATTVASGGRVLVAPVVFPAAGRPAQADRWESSAAWYQPGAQPATFVIAVVDPAAPGGGLSVPAVRARFGPPVATHRVGADVILLYRGNLLTRLSATDFPGPP